MEGASGTPVKVVEYGRTDSERPDLNSRSKIVYESAASRR